MGLQSMRRCVQKFAVQTHAVSAALLFSGLISIGQLPVFGQNTARDALKPSPRDAAIIRLPITDGKDLHFVHVTFGQGQSHERISSIVQDDQGFIWLGTNSGLRRYDGYRLRDFRHDPQDPKSLSGSYINTVFKDHTGKLWIASDEFLEVYDPVTETFRHSPFAKDEIEGWVWQISEDPQGMLWLATDGGLVKLDPRSWQTVRYRHRQGDLTSLSSDVVTSTFEQKDGTFWVATADGLDIFDPRTGRATQHIPMPPHRATSLQVESVVKLYEDHSNVLWVVFNFGNGLAKVDRARNRLIEYSLRGAESDHAPLSGIRTILETEDGTLWLGTTDAGILRLDPQRQHLVRYHNDTRFPDSVSSDQIVALFEDREHEIWVGATGGGLDRLTYKPLPFKTYRHELFNPNSLESNYTSSVLEDSHGDLWIGSMNVLTQIDRKTGQFKFYHSSGGAGGISSPWVISMVEDHSGDLWFGTVGNGLNRYDRQSGRFTVFRHNPTDSHSLSHDNVLSLFVDHTGRLWVGTEDGLDLYNPAMGRFKVYRPDRAQPFRRYRAINQDGNGNLWLGTLGGGLQRFDPTSESFTIFAQEGSAQQDGALSSGQVNAVCVDQSGAVWAGTQNGLNRLDPATGRFEVFYQRDGLPDSSINSILQDNQGNLWISTGNGLSRFDPTARIFRNYHSSDGLPGDEFYNYANAYKSPAGELFFNSYAGVVSFFPDQLIAADRPYDPPVVITDFQLFGKSALIGDGSPLKKAISFTDSIALSYRQSIFSFEFAALTYASPSRSRYRYRLEPLETEWNETDSDHRSATYTTLPPGTYIFEVQGRTERGDWSARSASVRIRVSPAWYQTGGFRIFCVAVFLLLLWGLYRWRIHEIHEQEKRFREAVETMPAMAFVADRHGNRPFVNRGWLEYTCMNSEQASGQGWQKAIYPEDLKHVLARWRTAQAAGEPLEYEARMRRGSDGAYRWFQTRARPLLDRQGRAVKWCAVETDIEDRKHAEQLQAELAHFSRVSTLGELAASISHELNQPIAASIMNADLVLHCIHRDPLDLAQVHERTARIIEMSTLASKIIDRLRSLYKKEPPKRAPLTVNEVIGEMVELLRAQAMRHGVSLRADLAGNLPNVIADRVQIQQVLMNLMLNGIEAMSDTGGILTVKSHLRADGQIEIKVSDTGPGLPPGKEGQIFDAFFTTKPQGSGMGLAISKSIIESHGGRIWAEGGSGQGATFHFTLASARVTVDIPVGAQ